MTTTAKGLVSLLLGACGMLALPAWAVLIAVTNNSFETPETGNSGFSVGCPPGWTCTPGSSSVGVYSPVNTQYPNGANGLPAGHTVPNDGSARTNTSNTSGGYEALFMGFVSGGVTVSQSTAAIIAGNTTYTLDVWVGHRNDQAWGNATIQLLANGAVLATSGLLADPGQGRWADYSLTFTTLGTDSHIGQTLGIALINNSANTSGQTNFDVVTLNSAPANAVPEPGTFLLLGPALIALGFLRRRGPKRALV